MTAERIRLPRCVKYVKSGLLALAAACATAQHYAGEPIEPLGASVRVDSLTAPSLGRRVRYHVVLPRAYDPARRYPVLWLLHGHGDDDEGWLRRTDLVHDVARYPIVVVLPAAENSWYVNAAADPDARYENFITRDLYYDVVHRYSVDTLRQAIAGLSMGGYGAVMLGLRYPRRYRFAGGLSAALSVTTSTGRADSVLWRLSLSILKAFGRDAPPGTSGHDVFALFHGARADTLPYFFLAIGTSDAFPSFIPANRDFTDSLRAYHKRYEYHELPGTHSWTFWNEELNPMLESAWKALAAGDSVLLQQSRPSHSRGRPVKGE